MIIDLNQRNYILTGNCLAEQGKYYDALCLYSRCNCYEASINRIVCLCLLGDTAYATEEYMKYKAKYMFTHNYYYDLFSILGEGFEAMFDFVEYRTHSSILKQNDLKISADEELIVNIGVTADDDSDLFSTIPDLDYVSDVELWTNVNNGVSKMYDVKSVDYFNSVRAQLESAYVTQDYKKAKKLSQVFLNIDTDHTPTLEAQIAVSMYTSDENDMRVVDFATRLVDNADADAVGIASAIEAVNKIHDDSVNQLLGKLLVRAYELHEDIERIDIEEYVAIAVNRLHDVLLAVKFADVLYNNFRNGSLEGLKLCLVAYYNAGDIVKARNCALNLSYAVPSDVYAIHLLKFLNSQHPELPPIGYLEAPSGAERHYSIAFAVIMRSEERLIDRIENKKKFTADDYSDVAVMLNYCKACLLSNNTKSFWKVASLTVAIIATSVPEDNNVFFAFAEEQVCSPITEGIIAQCLTEKMLKLGYNGKLLLPHGMEHSYVDFGNVKIADAKCIESICATIPLVLLSRSVLNKMLAEYDKLCNTVNVSEYSPRQIAYYLAKTCVSKFTNSNEDNDVPDEDKTLFVALNNNK